MRVTRTRVVHGAVQDWVATPWVIFNLADVAVVAGVVAFIVSVHRRVDIPAATMLLHENDRASSGDGQRRVPAVPVPERAGAC